MGAKNLSLEFMRRNIHNLSYMWTDVLSLKKDGLVSSIESFVLDRLVLSTQLDHKPNVVSRFQAFFRI